MTTEEKAKAYDEALKQAKKFHTPDSNNSNLKAVLELIFPELRESEDERILNGLIAAMKDQISCGGESYFGMPLKDILAYLEKQKEQKSKAWKPLEESMEALLAAIEGKWDEIKPTGYMSRRLEDLYDGLVNTFNIEDAHLPEKNYTEKDIEELKTLKSKIDASMEQKPTEKQDYTGLNDLERAIHRGFLCAGIENVSVVLIKETAQDCLAQMKPARVERGGLKDDNGNYVLFQNNGVPVIRKM